MEKKCSPSLNIKWLIPGIAFLCNPEIAGFDILPDFIGYCFLMFGLSCLRDLASKINEAFSAFKKLFWISLLQFVAFLVTSSSSVASEQATAYLCITFAVLIISWIFGIPAWLRFFDGLLYLSDMYNGSLDEPIRKKKHRSGLVSSMRVFTVIFVMIKPFLPFLTESTSLSKDTFLTTKRFRIYDFITLFRALGTFICLAIGIVWLIFMLKLILRALRDKTLISALLSEYQTHVLPETGRFVIRRTALGFLLLTFAMTASVDFSVDGRSFIPPFITSVLLISFFLVMQPYMKCGVLPYVFSGLHFISSIWLICAEKNFSLIKNIFSDSYQKAFDRFAIAYGVNRFFLALAVVSITVALRKLIDEHVGTETAKYRMHDLIQERRDEKIKYGIVSFLTIVVLGFNVISIFMAQAHPSMRLIGTIADVAITVVLRVKTNGTSSMIFNTYAPTVSDISLIEE